MVAPMENKCSICGGIKLVHFNKKYGDYLCGKHRNQLISYGKFLDKTPHSKYDKNEITLHDEYATMITRDSRYNIVAEYLIDLEDVEKIENIRWRSDKRLYAFNNSNKNIFLHNIILPTEEGYIVDHIDRNPLNNRKDNLRVAKHIQNCLNRDILKRNTSGVTGVSYMKNKDSWRSRIHVDGVEKMVYFGGSFEDAIYHRIKSEALYYKEYSRFYNKITENIEFQYEYENNKIELTFNLNGEQINK